MLGAHLERTSREYSVGGTEGGWPAGVPCLRLFRRSTLATTARIVQLPSELWIDVFRLACADGLHDVKQRLHLAQVCAYWRAVALDYPTFWAYIGVRTSRDASLIPIALEHSSGGVLVVELCWQRGSDERILSGAEQRAVVEALLAPEHRLRLKRLCVKYTNMRPQSLLPLLCAGDVFPALHDLVIQETYGPLPYLAPRLEGPSLRTLVLSGLELSLWRTFITPSLEHLCLHVVQYDDSYRLLNNILLRCTKLRRLEWNIKPSAVVPMLSDGIQSPLAPRLDTLRLGEQVCAFDVLRLINQRRRDLNPINDITVTAHIGHYIDSGILELHPEVFFRTSSLVDLRIEETDREIVIRDDVGRIRRLISFNNDYPWGMNDLWCTLARLYAIDQSLHSLRVRTNEWHGLAGGFASRAPTALTEVYIVLRGRMQGLYRDLDREGVHIDRPLLMFPPPTRVLNLPSLRRLIIVKNWLSTVYESRWPDYDPCRDPTIPHMRAILQHIECDASSRRVEVCVSVPELFEGRTLPRAPQETLLDGLDDKWVLCSHCTGT